MTLSDTMLVIVIRRRYYEHVPYIANILNGMQPPKMSQVCVSTDYDFSLFHSLCELDFEGPGGSSSDDVSRHSRGEWFYHSSEFVSLTL